MCTTIYITYIYVYIYISIHKRYIIESRVTIDRWFVVVVVMVAAATEDEEVRRLARGNRAVATGWGLGETRA